VANLGCMASAPKPGNPPRPVKLDHVAIFAAGTGGWAVALVVLWLLSNKGAVSSAWVWVAACGTALGLLGTAYAKWAWRARQ
jgi:predicted membrane metal-binding protein